MFLDVVGAAALVNSNNFTYPGLHQNVELNLRVRYGMDKHVTNTYLKKVQAPMGIKGTLLAWMESV